VPFLEFETQRIFSEKKSELSRKKSPIIDFDKMSARGDNESPLPGYMHRNNSRMALGAISAATCKANFYCRRDIQELRDNKNKDDKFRLRKMDLRYWTHTPIDYTSIFINFEKKAMNM